MSTTVDAETDQALKVEFAEWDAASAEDMQFIERKLEEVRI